MGSLLKTSSLHLSPYFLSLLFFLLLRADGKVMAMEVVSPTPPVAAPTGRQLQVLVPWRPGFNEFVWWQVNAVDGFSMEVFQHSLVGRPYKLVSYGDGIHTPNYDEMINKVANQEFDILAGDITITSERMEKVDFTHPYLESSLVVLVQSRYSTSAAPWDFLRPFSFQLWLSIVITFVATALVLFSLEKDDNSDLDGVPLSKQIINIFWFTSLTIFFSHSQTIHTDSGRLITIIWLLVVLIFTSSYTANLSSILSTVRLSPEIHGFQTLKEMDVPIGYQEGSFTHKFLLAQGIDDKRLQPLSSVSKFAEALRLGPQKGGVAAIVDELPYVQKFLASECDFTTVGGNIASFGGFGFAFPTNSSLNKEVSTRILSLLENGTIQNFKDHWISRDKCSTIDPAGHLRLRSFTGLFAVIIIIYTLCILWKFGRSAWLSISNVLRFWKMLRMAKSLLLPQGKDVSHVNRNVSRINPEVQHVVDIV